MPRLFTALEVPPEIADRLAEFRGGLAGARWIDPENYHLTLRFLGDIDRATAEEAADELARVHRPAFSVRIDGVGVLGTKKHHAIVARVEPSAALLELQAEIERICRRLDIESDGRKFTPHITLARMRSGDAHAIAEYLTVRGGFFAEPFLADRFLLLSSRDSVGGGPYVTEEAYDLAPPDARTPRLDARL